MIDQNFSEFRQNFLNFPHLFAKCLPYFVFANVQRCKILKSILLVYIMCFQNIVGTLPWTVPHLKLWGTVPQPPANWTKRKKFMNFPEIEKIYEFCKNRGILNMHNCLKGMDVAPVGDHSEPYCLLQTMRFLRSRCAGIGDYERLESPSQQSERSDTSGPWYWLTEVC